MSTQIASPTSPAPSRREVRRRAIIDAARATFLRDGYERTSVDAIADRAGVSKQTIYNYGADKASLFLQVVADLTGHCANLSVSAIESVPFNQESLEEELLAIAVGLNVRALDRDTMAFRPLIIAEAHRNPDRGRDWATNGQDPIIDALSDRLQRLANVNRLQLADSRVAAEHFFALVIYQADRLSLNGVSEVGIDTLIPGIRAAVAMFIAAYAPD